MKEKIKKWLGKLSMGIGAMLVLFLVDVIPSDAADATIYYDIRNGEAVVTDFTEYSSGAYEVPAYLGGYPVRHIDTMAFDNCNLITEIVLPNGLKTIGRWAFSNCTMLQNVVIPDSVNTIEQYAFSGCSSLASVDIPKGIQIIKNDTFKNCDSLVDITIPGNVKNIDNWAFYDCDGLETVEIQSGVVRIGDYAFSGCDNLAGVLIPRSVTNIAPSAFGYNKITLFVWSDYAISYAINNDYYYYLMPSVEDFVVRLYEVCLNRQPDAGGKANWINRLETGLSTGIQAAKGFIFSQEFKNKNYCNEDYVKQLYRAFMGREADAGGLAGWVKNLNNGMTREAVFNGFALSNEFRNICAEYDIKVGKAITVPIYGTIPTGNCSACGVEDGVTQFVKRLYRICLDREADAGGLASWSKQLWNHTSSGRKVAQGFIFSQEFKNKNYSNEVFVEYLYQAFMGRASDAGGKANWVKLLNQGWTRKQVFDGFAGSKEFTNICNQYGILRD